MHQFNRRLIKANGRVIDRGTADLEQLTLAVKFKSVFSLRIISRRSDGLTGLALVTKNHFPPRADRSWREAP
jgi:hypothetical protein